MRMRKLLLATLLAVGTLMLMPAAASAREQQTGTTAKLPEANEDCIKKLEDPNKKIDDCQKAPSPILPAKNEIIWGSIAFVVLLGALYKFAWPSLIGGMNARSERIRSDLDAADTAKVDAETVLSEYMARLSDARNESARIIEEARQAADALRRDQEQRLQTELAQLRERAAAVA